MCAFCHRFVGTEATQLAMLQGRNLAYSDSEITRKQKRLRTEFPSSKGSIRGGDSIENRANVVRHRSWSTGGDNRQFRRLLVASAPISDLPSLPHPSAKKAHIVGRIGEKKGGGNDDGGGVTVAVREVYRCERGAPCDEVYCSVRCRRMALETGHALICVGGSGEGRWVPAVDLLWKVEKRVRLAVISGFLPVVGFTFVCIFTRMRRDKQDA